MAVLRHLLKSCQRKILRAMEGMKSNKIGQALQINPVNRFPISSQCTEDSMLHIAQRCHRSHSGGTLCSLTCCQRYSRYRCPATTCYKVCYLPCKPVFKRWTAIEDITYVIPGGPAPLVGYRFDLQVVECFLCGCMSGTVRSDGGCSKLSLFVNLIFVMREHATQLGCVVCIKPFRLLAPGNFKALSADRLCTKGDCLQSRSLPILASRAADSPGT